MEVGRPQRAAAVPGRRRGVMSTAVTGRRSLGQAALRIAPAAHALCAEGFGAVSSAMV